MAGIPSDLLAKDGCPNTVSAFASFESIDPIKRTVRLWLRLYPQGDRGIALLNGGYFSNSVDVGYSANSQANWEIPSREWVGGRAIELPIETVSSQSTYPFDVYKGKFNLLINDAVTGEAIPVSMAISQKRLSGYNVRTAVLAKEYGVANENLVIQRSGITGFQFQVDRSSGQKMQVYLLVAIIVIGAGTSLFTTTAVLRRKRPPSLAALAWLATYLFALIQVRGEFPGSPSIGVSVDRYLTFPSIALLMGLIVVNAFSWLRRNDWDAENQDENDIRT